VAGIPPTGVCLITGGGGAIPGLRVGDYEASVGFYSLVFGAMDISANQDEQNGNTTWQGMLLIRSEGPPTQNADIFIEAASREVLGAVADRLDQESVAFTRGATRASDAAAGAEWITFADPDGNTVWVAAAEQQAS
jgi:catechol 2,3-dioxygenase-like lactoylglutathione lyase family enzyme